MLDLWLLAAGVIFVYMSLFFVIAMVLKDNGIVDIAWGGGFILIVIVTFIQGTPPTMRHFLVNGLVLLWGMRLALHIHARNGQRQGEDFRYANWRQTWGKTFVWRSFLQIYMLQGALLVLIAAPVIYVNVSRGPELGLLDMMGVLIWLVGFFFEGVGDYQMLEFKKKPEHQGKIIMHGLWTYTRHPNYFGETTMWWGLYMILLSVPGGWSAIISPLLITILLLKVSGIPMLEVKYEGRADWEQYKKRTNAFFPWFPKKK